MLMGGTCNNQQSKCNEILPSPLLLKNEDNSYAAFAQPYINTQNKKQTI